MKAFKRKPEQVVGERFDGSIDSAKRIIEWVRATEGEEIQYYDLRFKEERFGLGSDPYLFDKSVGDAPELCIQTAHNRYFLTPGNWLIRTEAGEDGEPAEFKTSFDDHLAKYYDEI